jgi:beta-N-acetylhexosaminidase
LDPHVTTAVNPLSKQEWDQKSGKAFKDLIDAGAMAVMSGHISFPAYDERDENLKMFPPATVSKKLLSGLLRGELGFEGIIVSDAITMGGVVNYMNYYDACALFFECGGDCLLFPQMDEMFYQEMERRLDQGMLSIHTLQNRVARMLAMKDQFARLQQSCPLEVPNYADHRQYSKTISENAVEIVRDRQKILPIPWKGEKKILHLILSNSFEENKTILQKFTEILGSTGSIVDEKVDPGPGWLFETMRVPGYDLVICSVGNPPTWGTNEIHLYGTLTRNMMYGWMRLRVPVVFVNHYDPFTYVEFDAAMDTIINTYGSTEFSLYAVMKKIFAFNI